MKTEQSILGDTESLSQITLKGSVQPQTRLPQIISSHAEDFCLFTGFEILSSEIFTFTLITLIT